MLVTCCGVGFVLRTKLWWIVRGKRWIGSGNRHGKECGGLLKQSVFTYRDQGFVQLFLLSPLHPRSISKDDSKPELDHTGPPPVVSPRFTSSRPYTHQPEYTILRSVLVRSSRANNTPLSKMNMNPASQQPTQPGGASPQQVAFFNSILRENCPFKFVFGGVTGTLKSPRRRTNQQRQQQQIRWMVQLSLAFLTSLTTC